jgi:hypothetical protein
LFLDGVGFQVLLRDQSERERGLIFAGNLLLHVLILSLFPDYPQTNLTLFVGQVEYSLAPEYHV